MRATFFACCCLVVVGLVSCKHKPSPPTLFELQENTGIRFTNAVKDTKDFNIFSYRNFYNGAGVATGDINNDGLPDVFFTSNTGDNKLYLNKGHFTFEDITASAGFANKKKWGTGVVMADVNGDGLLDIYICYAGYQKGISSANELYINNGNLTFTEGAKNYGLDDSGYTTHAAFFDYDGDGDLDCYLLNNSFIPVNTLNYSNKRELRAQDWPVADFLKGGGDKLLQNNSGHFTDVSKAAGIYGSLIGFGLGVTVSDVNGDNWPDIYISNDFFERDYLYINQKNGTFKEDLENWVQHTSLASMGADMGDINNDGYPDIFTTDMLPGDDYRLKTTSLFDNYDVYRLKENLGFYHQFMQNTLQLNNKNGKFSDIAYYSGVAASDWSWGGLFFDADNDGYSDLYICNGINHDVTDQDFIDFFANDVIQKMAMTGQKEEVDDIISKMPSHPIPNKAFRNMGNLRFQDAGTAWGFTQPSFSNGAAYADLDGDGDLDLVVNNVNQPSFVYKNNSRQQTKNNFIGVTLKGKGANPFAVGSIIKVYQGSQVLTREVMPGRGFQSSVDYKQIIGLGTKAADSIVITWPDRSVTVIPHPAVNKVYVWQQKGNSPTPESNTPAASTSTLLQQVAAPFDPHKEDDYVDFYYERNLPVQLSKEGPPAATGDVNGDGLQDVYIGGAANEPGQLYLQTTSGYVKMAEPAFEQAARFEDVAAVLFDSDGDGDLDLFVGSGGNNHPAGSRELQNRMYKNDGRGHFTIDLDALPFSGMNTAVAIANDIDGDGDQDLFVGSRSIPMNYGQSPVSYIYMNDGRGHFQDMAKTKNKDISTIGMVTGAAWADMTGDGKKDLVIVGEYMTPRIFTFTGDHFTEVKTNLNQLYGWWQTVATADMNGDGKEDLVLGNIGENFYLRPTATNPVKLWLNDFDGNGIRDKIITQTIGNREVPVFLKRDLTDQITALKKANLRYEEFANKTIQQLFPADLLQRSEVKQFTYSSSCIAINKGNGQFAVEKLPVPVQFSSVNAIACTDVNGDRAVDVIAGGNKFTFPPQFGRLDASYGHILLNDGAGHLSRLPDKESGLELRGQIKAIVPLRVHTVNQLLFLQNNEAPVLYQVRQKSKKESSFTISKRS